MRYKTKPCEIEAFQYDGDFINTNGEQYVPEWAIRAYNEGVIYFGKNNKEKYPPCPLYIKTLEGLMEVKIGDYIIKGLHNELYSCKPDIFKKKYELCEDALNKELSEV